LNTKLTLIMLRTSPARLCRPRPAAPEAGAAGVQQSTRAHWWSWGSGCLQPSGLDHE